MKEQLVSFKVAKLAKEKGFNEETYAFYDSTNTLINPLAVHKESNWTRHIILNKYNDGFVYNSTTGNKVNNYAAPTQSLLQNWLREKHNIVVFINPYPTTYAAVIEYNNREDKYATDLYNTYEKALETGLEQALKLIDNETIKSKSYICSCKYPLIRGVGENEYCGLCQKNFKKNDNKTGNKDSREPQ